MFWDGYPGYPCYPGYPSDETWGSVTLCKTFREIAPFTFQVIGYTLPETNGLHLEMDGWKMSFLLERPIFRGYVSLRGCKILACFIRVFAMQIGILSILAKEDVMG